MKKKLFFVLLFFHLFFSAYAEWNIDVTEIILDYLKIDSVDSLNDELAKVEKNKEIVKSKNIASKIWDKKDSNYLTSAMFIEAALTHDLALYYLSTPKSNIAKTFHIDYGELRNKRYVLDRLHTEYKKMYGREIDYSAVQDYKSALYELKTMDLYNILFISEIGSKNAYQIANKVGEWVADFFRTTNKWPEQNSSVVNLIIQETNVDKESPYIFEVVAFSLYFSIFITKTISDKISQLYGVQDSNSFFIATLEERTKIMSKQQKDNQQQKNSITSNKNDKKSESIAESKENKKTETKQKEGIIYDLNGNYIFNENELYGIKNKAGKIILPCDYSGIFLLENNYYRAYKSINGKNKTGIINKNGVIVFPFLFNYVSGPDVNGNFSVIDDKNKQLICNKDAEIIISSTNIIGWDSNLKYYYTIIDNGRLEMLKYSKNGTFLGSEKSLSVSFDDSGSYNSGYKDFCQKKAQEFIESAERYEKSAEEARLRGDIEQYNYYKKLARGERKIAQDYINESK